MNRIHPRTPQHLAFENLWKKHPGEMAKEIVVLWKQFNPGMEETRAEERLGQLVYVIKNEFDQVVGISTAYKAYIKQLRNHLYAFRMLLLPGYRIPGLSTKLLIETRDFLESIYKNDQTETCIGMITLVENDSLKTTRTEAITRDSGMVYIGNSGNGHHIRVYYFKDAIVQ